MVFGLMEQKVVHFHKNNMVTLIADVTCLNYMVSFKLKTFVGGVIETEYVWHQRACINQEVKA